MDRSQLEPRVAVSLLVSAENWKMDSFIEECIDYIYVHLEEVLCAHANFAGISESSITKLAQRFNHNDLDALRDKKDKVKSILFKKRAEKLFFNENSKEITEIFSCQACDLILTTKNRWKIRCVPSRTAIDRYGELLPLHRKDSCWEQQTFLDFVYSELGSWRRVYWYVWGIFNFLKCTTCGEYFRCCDLGKCRFHPDDPAFRQQLPPSHQSNRKENNNGPFVTYECCQQTVVRFDPLEFNTGCHLQDHTFDSADEKLLTIYADLLAHRTSACASVDFSVSGSRVVKKRLKRQTSFIISGPEEESSSDESSDNSGNGKILRSSAEDDRLSDVDTSEDSSEESTESEENDGLLSEVEPTTAHLRKIVRWKWNPNSSIRHSQDMQREHEHMKLVNLTKRLLKLSSPGTADSIKWMTHNRTVPVNFDSVGGVYARLEAEWKSRLSPKKLISSNGRFQKFADRVAFK